MGNPHVLVIPYPVQGHVIPFMELSKCLVKQGIKTTFVNTEENHKRVMDALAAKDGIEKQINLVSIPDGMESLEVRDHLEKHAESVFWFMPKKVEELIDQINASESDKITCVLADHIFGWAMEIAAEKGIRKRASFCAYAAIQSVLMSCIQKMVDDGIIDNDGTPTKKQMFQLSPTSPPMNTAHFGWIGVGSLKVQKMLFENMVRNKRLEALTEWLLCNSTYDLEPVAISMDTRILPVGPLLASNRLGDSAVNFLPEDITCLKWLDQQPPQSVIYVAFGSTAIFDHTQFQELATGLELSNRPFLWVVRPDFTDEISYAYLKAFQDRTATRSHIVSWAPQQKVLAHSSVACFISHCGWNSTMEGVSNGIPFLCWPYFSDQFHNETYICKVWKVGLGFTRDDRRIINHEEIKFKLDQLLDNEEYKARALSLKELVMHSIKEGGGSYKNFKNFIQWIKA
ncbi:UDP-glycosyltransferase [Melia azedarach]|uniref:UDP-glycosyltransferase n=1 Tax=Melia azedarach TaxID=155640 RepID=A0ACC1X793_MELAZ|nr:UDP-glycosyltransferase [Melia azedarach]